MKLGYATTFDSQDVGNWSGTPFYMSEGFRKIDIDLHVVGQLKKSLPRHFKIKQIWKKLFFNERESPRFNLHAAMHYSKQLEKKMVNLSLDAIIAPQINPIAYLNSNIPIVLWTDALYAGLLNFYPGFIRHSKDSIAQGHEITTQCLKRASLLIFSSDWAARTAMECYGAPSDKIKVVPFGANFQCEHSLADIQRIIKNRARNKIKLLFIGKDWQRKGGDIVFAAAKAIHEAGGAIELHFIGCHPPKSIKIPSYIHCHGFVSKNSPAAILKMKQLFYQSHFLFVPSRAEAYGIVFCEANAFGLPCITSDVGGIETIVKNGVNGYCFPTNTSIETYCQYIINLVDNYSEYENLALSAFNEYQMRLNWRVATERVKQLIQEI